MDERRWRREFIRLSLLETAALRYIHRARKIGHLGRLARAERLREAILARVRVMAPGVPAYG
jgi:hypothetical protein